MDKLIIRGTKPLEGEIKISGAKNAVLPIMAATLLTDETCVIENVPCLVDVTTMGEILTSLGKRISFEDGTICIESTRKNQYVAPYELIKIMRGSFCVLGPLAARFKKAKVSLPGGCVIGPRPVDLHLKGLNSLGADININEGYVEVEVSHSLRGCRVYLGGPYGSSVLATANIMMAATLAEGMTVIENAACEPEVVDLGEFLIKMGANISGLGSPWIRIEGVKELSGARHPVIPDRIEASTYAAACIITRGKIILKNARSEHMGVVLDKFKDSGTRIASVDGGIDIDARGISLRPVNIDTLPYPGFPTDMQAQFTSCMTQANGVSIITEKVYPERFMHLPELNRLGANIQRRGPHAIIDGKTQLKGAQVMASDLRASAALILAALAAEGITEIHRVYHLDRGYENLEDKLNAVGADTERVKE